MLLTLTLLTLLHAAPAADSISGTWRITGDVAGNPLDQICTIQQNGAVLSGSCGAEGEAVELTGEVTDGKITFSHGGEYDGQPLTIVYSGALESPQEIRGTVWVQPFDVSGVFTAKPTPAPEQ